MGSAGVRLFLLTLGPLGPQVSAAFEWAPRKSKCSMLHGPRATFLEPLQQDTRRTVCGPIVCSSLLHSVCAASCPFLTKIKQQLQLVSCAQQS